MNLKKLKALKFVIIFSLIVPWSAYSSPHPDDCWKALNYVEKPGEPSGVERLIAGDIVFRRYVSSEEFARVLESHELVSGILPFIHSVGGVGYVYPELTGIHVTLPSVSHKQVFVESDSYIDFRVPPKTEVTKISDGFYLIEGPQATPNWLAELYNKFKDHIEDVPMYQDALYRLKQSGGPKNPLKIKIAIVGSDPPSKEILDSKPAQ